MRTLLLVLPFVACTPEPRETPLEGPGFDETTGDLLRTQDEYMVGITYLEVRNAPGPGGRFGDHADAIGTYLFTEQPDGWLGAAFRNVGRLRWWTLSVWESEEAMLDFVVSEPHASAMLEINEVSRGAVSRSLTMPAEDLPVSWEQAMELLAADPHSYYGDPSWP